MFGEKILKIERHPGFLYCLLVPHKICRPPKFEKSLNFQLNVKLFRSYLFHALRCLGWLGLCLNTALIARTKISQFHYLLLYAYCISTSGRTWERGITHGSVCPLPLANLALYGYCLARLPTATDPDLVHGGWLISNALWDDFCSIR